MKQLLSILIALTISATSIYAGEKPYSVAPFNSLTTAFPKATEIVWTEAGPLHKATFSSEGKVYTAFFDGVELIATTRSISVNELPKGLKENLKNELNGSWVRDLVVMTTPVGSEEYFVQLENAYTKTIKQSAGNKWVATNL